MIVEVYEYLTGLAMPVSIDWMPSLWTEAVGDTDNDVSTYSEAELLLEVV